VLASIDGHPVAVRRTASSSSPFIPELTDDSRVHALLMALATASASVDSSKRRAAGGNRMRDPRVAELARILVGYSTKVKEGDTCVIEGSSAGAPLIAAIYEEVLKAGASPGDGPLPARSGSQLLQARLR